MNSGVLDSATSKSGTSYRETLHSVRAASTKYNIKIVQHQTVQY